MPDWGLGIAPCWIRAATPLREREGVFGPNRVFRLGINLGASFGCCVLKCLKHEIQHVQNDTFAKVCIIKSKRSRPTRAREEEYRVAEHRATLGGSGTPLREGEAVFGVPDGVQLGSEFDGFGGEVNRPI